MFPNLKGLTYGVVFPFSLLTLMIQSVKKFDVRHHSSETPIVDIHYFVPAKV